MAEFILLLSLAILCFGTARLLAGVNSKDTETARLNYIKALQEKDKTGAVKWGRIYFGSLRWMNGYCVTIYDEQRIQNDINAHC
jgi:hypothetical protein